MILHTREKKKTAGTLNQPPPEKRRHTRRPGCPPDPFTAIPPAMGGGIEPKLGMPPFGSRAEAAVL